MQTAAMFANLPIGSVVYGSMLAPPNMPPGMHLIGGELTATPLSPGCLMRYVKTSSGWSAGEMITQQMLQEELASQKNPNLGVANVEVERPSKEEKQTDAAGLQDVAQMLRLPTVTNNRKKCGMKAKKGQTLMQSGMFLRNSCSSQKHRRSRMISLMQPPRLPASKVMMQLTLLSTASERFWA